MRTCWCYKYISINKSRDSAQFNAHGITCNIFSVCQLLIMLIERLQKTIATNLGPVGLEFDGVWILCLPNKKTNIWLITELPDNKRDKWPSDWTCRVKSVIISRIFYYWRRDVLLLWHIVTMTSCYLDVLLPSSPCEVTVYLFIFN